jgi:hypothetical protein
VSARWLRLCGDVGKGCDSVSFVTGPGWMRGVITEYCNYQTIRLVGEDDSVGVHDDVVDC